MKKCILLLCMVAASAQAQHVKPLNVRQFHVNLQSIQAVTGLADDPSRSFAQTAAAWVWGAGAPVEHVFAGYTTDTTCTTKNVVMAVNSANPVNSRYLSSHEICSSGFWKITIHKPSFFNTLYTWTVLNAGLTPNDREVELAGLFSRELGRILGANNSTHPNCITTPQVDSYAQNALFVAARNNFCESEIAQLWTDPNKRSLTGKTYRVRLTGWPAPTGIATSSYAGMNYSISIGSTARGAIRHPWWDSHPWLNNDPYYRYYNPRDGYVNISNSSSVAPHNFHEPAWSSSAVGLPVWSYRKGTLFWDPQWQLWYYFVHAGQGTPDDTAVGNHVHYYVSVDRYSWTYVGILKYGSYTTPGTQPLLTRSPVSVTFDPNTNQILVVAQGWTPPGAADEWRNGRTIAVWTPPCTSVAMCHDNAWYEYGHLSHYTSGPPSVACGRIWPVPNTLEDYNCEMLYPGIDPDRPIMGHIFERAASAPHTGYPKPGFGGYRVGGYTDYPIAFTASKDGNYVAAIRGINPGFLYVRNKTYAAASSTAGWPDPWVQMNIPSAITNSIQSGLSISTDLHYQYYEIYFGQPLCEYPKSSWNGSECTYPL